MKHYFFSPFRAVPPVLILLGLALAFGPAHARGEMYGYTQDDGTKAYTDDLSKVPPKYRDKVKPVDESGLPSLGVVKTDEGSVVDKALSSVSANPYAVPAAGALLVVVVVLLVVRAVKRRRQEKISRAQLGEINKIRKV